jgi:16S rRNA (guanine(1405)-N(7))-methyltransferase
MSGDVDDIQRLVEHVRRSKKYQHVSEKLVREIGAIELVKRSSFKEAVKATRNKLHQVGGLYFERTLDYQRAFEDLATAQRQSETALRDQSIQIMQFQTSTRERVGILSEFFDGLMSAMPEPRVVLDLACGLNPLALPWMKLPADTQYYAYDIYADLIEFVGRVLDLHKQPGSAEVRDIVHEPPSRSADLALVLKSFPCLEQIEKGAGRSLVQALKARYVAVSYPVHSVGGRGKGMRENYQEQFEAALMGLDYGIQRLEFNTELVFVIDKG